MGVMLPFEVRRGDCRGRGRMEGQRSASLARTGYVDDYYFIAQWFPKLGVLEDRGWNTSSSCATEFYSDYGVYDVRITVPREFVVGATGCRASLTPEPPARCAEGEIAPGNGADWNYRYWAAMCTTSRGPPVHFRVSRRMFEHTGLPPVEMQLLLHPSTPGRSRATSTPRSRSASTANGSGRIAIATSRSSILPFKAAAAAVPMLFTAGSRWIAPHASRNPRR